MQNGNIPVVPVVLAIFAMIAFVLFLGMIALFAVLISRAAKRRSYDKARGDELRAAAEQTLFTFQPQAPLSALPFFAGYELFEGTPLKFENVMTRKIDGRESAI